MTQVHSSGAVHVRVWELILVNVLREVDAGSGLPSDAPGDALEQCPVAISEVALRDEDRDKLLDDRAQLGHRRALPLRFLIQSSDNSRDRLFEVMPFSVSHVTGQEQAVCLTLPERK